MASEDRGQGFVHLNTPSSIEYTKGKTLSLTDLSRPRTRVESVALPAARMQLWRQGCQQYIRQEGYQPFAADAEADRMGEGPVLPALLPPSTRAPEPFFVLPIDPQCGGSASVAGAGAAAAAAASGSGAAPTASDCGAATDGAAGRGIRIVSHHKVAGMREFEYPDYDGILTSGVVPEVVVTAEEKAEQEAAKAFYISPLTMTSDELDAFEELQALWKSRSRSHSASGARHRAMAGGIVAPGTEEVEVSAHSNGGGATGHAAATRKRGRADGESAGDAEMRYEDEIRVDEENDDLLAEALRMADELLQLT